MDFEKYLEQLENNLSELATLEASKEINYGHQFQYKRGADKVTLCVYNGKKGLRLVWQGNNTLRAELEAYMNATASAAKSEAKRSISEEIWAGSDESGKGDFFGPLVIGAVALDGIRECSLKVAGVKDCKLLTDKKILELEPIIKREALAYSVLQLKPKFYNQRYAEVVAHGGKLNQLLASGHINALTAVLKQLEEAKVKCDYALVDQFTTSGIVMKPLQERFPEVDFSQRPKAESNTAVAAASILARAQFIHTMEELAKLAEEAELPKGGGEAATECAKRLAAKFGKNQLVNFVKTHFVNFSRI